MPQLTSLHVTLTLKLRGEKKGLGVRTASHVSCADCRCGNLPAPSCRGSLGSWVTGTDVGRPSPCRKRGFPSDCTLCKLAGAVRIRSVSLSARAVGSLFWSAARPSGPSSGLQHDLLVPVLVCSTTFWKRGVGCVCH